MENAIAWFGMHTVTHHLDERLVGTRHAEDGRLYSRSQSS